MDCSMPGFPVLHYLPEFAQTHVCWVNDAIQSSHPLSPPFSSCPQSCPASGSFPVSQVFASRGQSIGASASILPMNIQDWFPLEFTGDWVDLLASPRDCPESSPAPQFESISSFVLRLVYHPTHTCVHDYWKKHSFDYLNLCWQSDISGFWYAV